MKNVYQKKPTLPLSAHTEKWWHSRARSLPGKQWRVTQEAIAVLAGGKCNFKQTSSLFLSFPTGIMKIMMLRMQIHLKVLFNNYYGKHILSFQERSTTGVPPAENPSGWFFTVSFSLRKIFSLVTLFPFLISLDSPLSQLLLWASPVGALIS